MSVCICFDRLDIKFYFTLRIHSLIALFLINELGAY